MKEVKVLEFLTLKQDSLSVHEYVLKFTQLSCYASEIVKDMRIQMSLFVAFLGPLSSKEGRAALLIGDMDISRFMVHVQQVEEEKLRDIEEFKSKKSKSWQMKGSVNCSSFPKQKGQTPLDASSRARRNKDEYVTPRAYTLCGTGIR